MNTVNLINLFGVAAMLVWWGVNCWLFSRWHEFTNGWWDHWFVATIISFFLTAAILIVSYEYLATGIMPTFWAFPAAAVAISIIGGVIILVITGALREAEWTPVFYLFHHCGTAMGYALIVRFIFRLQ